MIYDINGNVIYDDKKPDFRNSAFLKSLHTDASGTMQGGCTDGQYIYYILYNQNKLCKYNILTGELTTRVYTSGLYGHANSMTYNPDTGMIYIVVMDDGGNIGVVNPSTLADEDMFILRDTEGNVVQTSGIAYDRKNNRYLFTKGAIGYFYDSSFNFISSFNFPETTLTYQGVECDGTYIYRPLWDSTNSVSIIRIYDYEGNFVKDITLSVSYELEDVINDWANNWYLNFNIVGGGGELYYTGLIDQTNFETVEQMFKILSRN